MNAIDYAPQIQEAPDLKSLPGGRRLNKALPCKLTSEEREEKAKELARHHIEIGRLTDEKKAVVDEYKHKIAVHESKVGEYSTQIHAGFEHRETACWYELDTPEKGQKTLYREDTLEAVEITKMTEDDFQMEIADLGE